MRKRFDFLFLVFTVTLCSLHFSTAQVKKLPEGFVDVKAMIPGIVLDMRYFTEHNFLGTRVRGYGATRCILTREAAEALKKVQAELEPYGLSLKVYDAYRPQRAVDHFVEWAKDVSDTLTKREFYPLIDKGDLFPLGYISERSSHSRGSTVDLTLVPVPVPEQEVYVPHENLRPSHFPAARRFGDNSLDMGTGFDAFHGNSATESLAVGPQQRANRLLLRTLMDKHGFRNYAEEWWHYTLRNEPYPETYFDFMIE